MKLSAIVLTHNNEDYLDACLNSLRFCDEIIVVDDNSTDSTLKIARNHQARILNHDLNSDFAAQRNYGLNSAKSEWVIFVDADEQVSDKLAAEIKAKIKNQKVKGYYLKRIERLLGHTLSYGEAGSNRYLRLGQKNAGLWARQVHEEWKITGKIDTLKNRLTHNSDNNLDAIIKKLDYYSDLHYFALKKEGKRSNILKICAYPLVKFLINYLAKRGFLDGTAGLVFSMLHSLHSFLGWSKLWLNQKQMES